MNTTILWEADFDESNKDYFYRVNYLNKNGRPVKKFLTVDKNSERIYAGLYYRNLHRVGSRTFIKSECNASFSYKNKKIYGNNLSHLFEECLPIIAKELGFKWAEDLPRELRRYWSNKSILKSILIGTIYNQETLVKAIGKRVFQLKDFSWKALRDYLLHGSPANLYDLRDFTKNINDSMRAFTVKSFEGNLSLFSPDDLLLKQDLVSCASRLNQKVDLTWSNKRMQQEHQNQIWLLNQKEIASKSVKEIYPKEITEGINSPTIRLLNTEMEVFNEGLNMHHCIYSCYWRRIKRKETLAFHMNSPEDCTFNTFDGENISQIYLSYDRLVKPETRKIAQEYITKYSKLFKEMLKDPLSNIYIDGLEYPFDNAEITPN